MKKLAFIILALFILVVLFVSVGTCIKTIIDFNSYATTEEALTTTVDETKKAIEFSKYVQIADYVVEVENGKISYDEEEGNIIYKFEEGYDFITFKFQGAVITKLVLSEDNEYYFSDGTEKINVPKSWNGTEVKEVPITISSEECGETKMLLEKWS